MPAHRQLALTAASIALTAAGLHAQPAPPAQLAATVIVLDGSNSMNGRLPNDKNFKFVTVREALRASLPAVSGTEVGLVAFGARRASDCNDAEVLASPSADTTPIMAALERFQPRGFSPVALSLRTASKALPAGAGKASIVLVLDDLASCRTEDPCALAGQLKRDIPALSIHVVVLGPRPADLPVLACIVKQTGGQLFQVADGAGVAPAIQEVMTLAGLDRRDSPQPATPERSPPMRTVAPKQPAGPRLAIDQTQPGLHLTARLAEGAPPLLVPVHWRIWRTESPRPTDTGSVIHRRDGDPIATQTAPAISIRLPNGRYEVEAKAGLVSARRNVEVASQGPMVVNLDLKAALIVLSAPLVKGIPSAGDTTLKVLALGPPAAPVWVGRGDSQDLVVAPGSYRVRAEAGLAHAERVLTVGEGVTSEVEMPLNAGRLLVEERLDASAPKPSAPHLVVEADDPDVADRRREVYRASASRLELTLPAGVYTISARRDSAELRERLTIKPGETVSRQFSMPLVRIRLVSRMGAALPGGLPVSYRIERLDSATAPLQRWGMAEQVLDLAPGRYRIEARIGEQNAVAVREIDVRGGTGEQRIEIDAGAGVVELKPAGGGSGLGLGEVYWQVFNERDEPIWRTGITAPLLALSTGRYRVRAELRDRVVERAFEVRTGDRSVVEVGG